jgi:hypothetical protein
VAWRRRTWRHPAPCSPLASSPGVSVPPLLVATRPAPISGTPVTTRRKASPAPPPLLPLSPPPPFSPLCGATLLKGGKTPGRLEWRGEGSIPGVVDARSKRREGKDTPALQDWLLKRDWQRGRPPVATTAPVASPAGAYGTFPPADSPWGGPRAHARARRAWQLGGPAVLSSRARPRSVQRREASSREKVWLVEKGSPTCGSHLSEIERVRGKVWFSWAKVDARAGPVGYSHG